MIQPRRIFPLIVLVFLLASCSTDDKYRDEVEDLVAKLNASGTMCSDLVLRDPVEDEIEGPEEMSTKICCTKVANGAAILT